MMQRYSGGLKVPQKMTELIDGLTTDALSLVEFDTKYVYIGNSVELAFQGGEEPTNGLYPTVDSQVSARRLRVKVWKYQALAFGDVTHTGVGAGIPVEDLVVDYRVQGM